MQETQNSQMTVKKRTKLGDLYLLQNLPQSYSNHDSVFFYWPKEEHNKEFKNKPIHLWLIDFSRVSRQFNEGKNSLSKNGSETTEYLYAKK